MNPVFKEFKETGNCIIDLDYASEKWNHLWSLVQLDTSKFTLVKYVRIDSDIRAFKAAISCEQALELIERVGLTNYPSPIFRRSSSWKRKQDMSRILTYNKK